MLPKPVVLNWGSYPAVWSQKISRGVPNLEALYNMENLINKFTKQ